MARSKTITGESTITRQWAQEMMLDYIDSALSDKAQEAFMDTLDDQIALLKQRNRIAQFLGLPTKDYKDIFSNK